MALTNRREDSDAPALNGNEQDLHFNEPLKLKKQLSLTNGIGIIIGIIIGSGIFVSPIGVLESSGSVGGSLIIWLLCGLLSLCGALCYAELGTAIPKSGGEFVYLLESFGGLCAFLYLWVALLIITPTGNAIIALTFAKYVLQPFFGHCQPPEQSIRLLAASVIMFLTFINCYNVKWATKIQDFFACTKLVALAIIIITGIVYMSMGRTQNFSQPFEDSSYQPEDIASAFYSGMFSFSGWNCLNFVTEELKKPTRNLPRAIYISVPLVTCVYFLTNLSYFAILTRQEILSSQAVAGDFGDKTLGVMSWIMPVCVALSTFGGLNGCIFSAARLFFVGARQGHLPNAVAMINVKCLTPSPSLIFLASVTILYLWSGHVGVLINFTQFVESLFMTLTVGALLWLRVKEPNKKRPIKVNTILPVIFLLIGIFLVVLPCFKYPYVAGVGLAITFSGIPAYLIFVYWKEKPNIVNKISGMIGFLLSYFVESVLPAHSHVDITFDSVILSSAICAVFITSISANHTPVITPILKLHSCTRLIQKLLLCSPQERKTTCEEEIRVIDEYFDQLEKPEIQSNKVE